MFFMDLDFCVDTANIWQIVGTVVRIIKWVIPVILLILGTIDLAKASFAGEEKEIKAAQGMLIKRVIYSAVIFLLPTLILAVLSLVREDSTDQLCWKCVQNPTSEECEQAANNAW